MHGGQDGGKQDVDDMTWLWTRTVKKLQLGADFANPQGSFCFVSMKVSRVPRTEIACSLPTVMDPTPSSSSLPAKKKPVVIITIGMAGSGKTTFVQRINSYLHSLDPPAPPYILNLDPAVTNTPFDANIDIRDTVNYKEVMKQCVARSVWG